MRNLQILLVSLCVGATWQAFADNPPPPPPAESAPPAEPAKPEKPAAAALEEQTKRLRAMGYKPEVQNGVTVFCRKETPMGTRFEKKICGNGDEIERNAQAARDAMQNAPRQSH
jgi:hypothetical protein